MAGRTGRAFSPEEIQAITAYVNEFTEGKHYVTKDSCHLWIRATQSRGYGTASIRFEGGNAQVTTHRAAWIAKHKTNIPTDKTIDHLCRNKTCINVDHMEIVSRADNNINSNSVVMRLKAQTRCSRGHDYAPNNLVQGSRTRSCLACSRAIKAQSEARSRGKQFSEQALTELSHAFYRHITQGHHYPLFRRHPEAWENVTYQPKIRHLEEDQFYELKTSEKQAVAKT